ncbi:MAG: hypothetical protein ACREON_07045 [Gemmatimonadaceae bacterium]
MPPERPSPLHTPYAALATLATVRELLGRRLDDESLDGELHRALRQLSAEARQRGLRAEQVVIVLKQAWEQLTDEVRAGGRDRRQIIQRAISISIEEYYRGE